MDAKQYTEQLDYKVKYTADWSELVEKIKALNAEFERGL